MGSLPFKDIDSKTWDIVLNTSFGNDEMRKSNMIKSYLDMEDPEEFIYEVMSGYFEGIGDAKTRSITEGWLRNFKEMQTIVKNITFKCTTVSNGKPINTYVTFTGCRNEELVDWLSTKGIGIIDFGSKTQYLIVPNKEYQNKKTEIAKNKGLHIIPIDEVKDFFESF